MGVWWCGGLSAVVWGCGEVNVAVWWCGELGAVKSTRKCGGAVSWER